MFDRGRVRAEAQIRKALDRGEGAERPAGVALARRAIEPVAKAIEEFCATANSGRAGRRHIAALLLQGVDPELAAYIAVRFAISAAARQTRNTIFFDKLGLTN